MRRRSDLTEARPTGRTGMPRAGEPGLQVGHRVLGEVEDRGGQRRVRPAAREDVLEVLERSRAARGDDRDLHRRRHGGGQLAVEAGARAVAIDRGEQDLAGAARLGLARPLDGIAPGRRRAAARVHGVAAARALGVDGDDDGLAAVAAARARVSSAGRRQRGAVQADLVGAGVHDGRGVGLGPDAAADGERNEELRRDGADRLEQRAPAFERGGDVEQDELVDAFDVVAPRQRGRVAGARQSFELHALDDRAVANIQAGDDAFRQHAYAPAAIRRKFVRHGQADVRRLLGMELHAADAAPLDDAGEDRRRARWWRRRRR